MFGIWCLMFIGDRVFEMHRSETARYEWDRHYHRCFIFFILIVEKHFVPSFVSWMFHSRICHHRWNMHTHTAENRFSRGKCFTYLRFFLSIKDRLFALSSGRKKKKTVDRRIVDFPIFHGCFRINVPFCYACVYLYIVQRLSMFRLERIPQFIDFEGKLIEESTQKSLVSNIELSEVKKPSSKTF